MIPLTRSAHRGTRSIARLYVTAVSLLPLVPVLRAQAQSTVFNREIVVLDPAHGGADIGARISDLVSEKDISLQFAVRLRSLLVARGFTVVSTRDLSAADNGTQTVRFNQRAEIANRAHAVACLVLHATGSGGGVHIGASLIGSSLELTKPGQSQTSSVPSWDRAQEAWVTQSVRLANQVGTALSRSSVSIVMERVALHPLDNLMCPAVSIELAPERHDGKEAVPVTDTAYQQHVAEAIAGALVLWRNQAQQPDYVPLSRPSSSVARPVPDQTESSGPGA